MSNIVDLFNKNTIEFTKSIPQRWMIENKNLTNFETRKFSIPVMTPEMKNEYLNIDIEDQLLRVIKSEIEQDISRLLLKNIFTTNKFDYLDLRPDGSLMNGRIHLENLSKMILSNHEYTNLISNNHIIGELQDSQYFSPYMVTHDFRPSTLPYCCGKLDNRVEIYNDPYMKFNDGRICLFNQVEFNIGEMKAYDSTPGSLAPKIIIEYNIDYNVVDSKLIFVIEDETSEAYFQYKSLQRDIKIDNILDGETSK